MRRILLVVLLGLCSAGICLAGPPRPAAPKRGIVPITSEGYTLSVTYINCDIGLDLQSNRTSFSLNMNGPIQAPVDSKAVAISGQFEVAEAIDENNHDLLEKQRAEMRNSPQPRNYNLINRDSNNKPMPGWTSIGLRSETTPLMIQRLTGQVYVMLVKTEVTKEFDAAKGTGGFQEIAPLLEVSVGELPRESDQSVKISYRTKGPRNAKWGWGVAPPFMQPVEFTDQDGKKIESSIQMNSMNNGANGASGEMQVTPRPTAGQKTTKIKIKVVTEVEEKPIQFEIKDLILPTAGPVAPST